MYKDKEKQREAGRERVRRYRDKQKGVTSKGVTDKALPIGLHGAQVLGIDPTETADSVFDAKPERTAQGNIRISKKGVTNRRKGVTEQGVTVSGSGTLVTPERTAQGMTEVFKDKGRHKIVSDAESTRLMAKRGKDIKCFADLPPDVQKTIRNISESNEEFQRRAGIAIRYQHLFPDRFHSTGIAI